ncbi:hypothetical protein EXIGLDRAFT_777788 [Exidia glandulosa HHB12029]|uniref:F-box domain-containing protein n=1 Tax=Exidia glandulosa HHB12029 TaxID=1314781 RepID=A0A165CVJ4_EXIGL|nr:hypothetical protein EXIGLDRAFT_777788 [Exidia glandulosa HHB12029]
MELPSDLLCDIFRLVDDSVVDQKYALSQVCVHWRMVALDAPLLWSTLTLVTPLDIHRLEIVLARSQDLPLDITLPKDSWISYEKASVDLLTEQRGRIRRLLVEYDDDHNCFLPRLLSQGFTFPLLEDLHVSRFPADLRPSVFLSAPWLRSLHLTHLECEKSHGLLVPSLNHLYLDDCTSGLGVGLMTAVFTRCPQLRTLTYRQANAMFQADVSDDSSFINAGGFLPNLQTFRLNVAVSSRFLRFVIGNRVLHEMEVFTTEGEINATTQELLSHVFRGLDKPVELRFDSEDGSSFEVRDRAGRIRQLSVLPAAPHLWRLPNLWIELLQQLNISASLETIYTSTCHWNELVSAFASRPPEGRTELHIKLVYSMLSNFYGGMTGSFPLQLKCPNLVKVVFYESDGYARWARRDRTILVILDLLSNITSTARSISLCASDVGLTLIGTDPETLSALRVQLPEQFVLCEHCNEQCRDRPETGLEIPLQRRKLLISGDVSPCTEFGDILHPR